MHLHICDDCLELLEDCVCDFMEDEVIEEVDSDDPDLQEFEFF